MNPKLHFTDYTIGDNVLRAYRDNDGRLVFVLDYFTNEYKPNVLLVIKSDGNRKWDDILSNDFNMDLEDIRPKKDNKYQKLDIEYDGLNIYDELFTAYDDNQDTHDALAQLDAFRTNAARNSAIERLNAAEITATNARETIIRTNETIIQLQSRQKELRTKLSDLRRNIGKEPTKQSAAKILRTESQLETTNDKLGRANKRVQNAKHRLSAAMDEIELAQRILNTTQSNDANTDIQLPAPAPHTEIQVVSDEPKPLMQYAPDDDDPEPYEPEAIDMADEEVKPLFDQDPNILDEELAFKPIDFSIPETLAENESSNNEPEPQFEPAIEPTPTPELESPLSFQPIAFEEDTTETYTEPTQPAPSMLDNLTPISVPTDTTFSETTDIPTEQDMEEYSMPFTTNEPAPVLSSQTNDFAATTPAAPYSGYPAADASERPASPYAGTSARPASPVAYQPAPQQTSNGKPTFLYYILLILLIALSIFTLWIYQQKTNTGTPELGATQPQIETPATEPEPVAEPEPVIEPEPVAEPEPVIEPEPVVTPIPERPSTIDGPVADPVVEPKPEIPTEEEILAKKPAYNVSADDKMFVADADFESSEPTTEISVTTTAETVAEPAKPTIEIAEPVIIPVIEPEVITTPEPAPIVTTEPEPVVAPEPEPMQQYVPVETIAPTPTMMLPNPPKPVETIAPTFEKTPQVVTSEVYKTTTSTPAEISSVEYTTTEVINTCADGNRPDMYGCCAGEEFVDFGNNTQLCCIIGSDECFEPLID